MIASVEAIFLSTFILISQNRMAEAADRRAELDLQVSLLAEQETTKLVQLVSRIAGNMGIRESSEPDVQEMKRGVAPETGAGGRGGGGSLVRTGLHVRIP